MEYGNLLDEYFGIPPITRTYLSLTFLTTVAYSLELVSFFSLYWNLQLVMKGEVGWMRFPPTARPPGWRFPILLVHRALCV